jgi:hypothetical protein
MIGPSRDQPRGTGGRPGGPSRSGGGPRSGRGSWPAAGRCLRVEPSSASSGRGGIPRRDHHDHPPWKQCGLSKERLPAGPASDGDRRCVPGDDAGPGHLSSAPGLGQRGIEASWQSSPCRRGVQREGGGGWGEKERRRIVAPRRAGSAAARGAPLHIRNRPGITSRSRLAYDIRPSARREHSGRPPTSQSLATPPTIVLSRPSPSRLV